jgi:hypothetical protein
MIKNFFRIYLFIFLINLIENFLLLLLFGNDILNVKVLVGNFVFTLAITLVLYFLKLTRRD